ncbi:MAG: Na+/H+ antiporter [Solirubrobacterales bacterium]
MNDIELLIVLVGAAAVLVRIADAIAIPYPIVLVLGGLGIGLIPAHTEIEVDPEVFFLVFLPPLLQSAGYYASPQELRAELWPVAGLVLGLSLTTMAAVAIAAEAVIPELSMGEALVLGAILAPTDPVAATTTFSRIGVSDRVSLLVEGESMLNDAVGLVAYRVALAAVVSGSFAVGDAGLDLLVAVVGGVGIGLAVAAGLAYAIKRVDDAPLSILLTVLSAYFSFALAEQVEASGVLAVVTGGLYYGWRSHDIFDADLRLNATAFWQVLVFALNAILFILLGLQFPDILERIGDQLSTGEIVGYGLLVSGVVIATRIVWQFLPLSLAQILPAAGSADPGDDWRERLLIGWCGMRGAVSLAAALALPLELDSGAPLGERDLIIYLTVAVIICTLVIQGLTLPALVRRLGLGARQPWAPDEAVARLAAAQAALDRLDELEASGDPVPETAIERLRELYRARFARCVAALSGEGGEIPIEDPLHGYRRLREDLISSERRTLLQMRGDGRVKQDVLRRIERDLDLDQARLRS